MTESATKATAVSLIHSQKGASQLIIVGWETNTFETHFQVKNYRNDPWKYSLNFWSQHKRISILKRHSSQMVLCCWPVGFNVRETFLQTLELKARSHSPQSLVSTYDVEYQPAYIAPWGLLCGIPVKAKCRKSFRGNTTFQTTILFKSKNYLSERLSKNVFKR